MSNRHFSPKLRHLIQSIAPGLLALVGYRPSWLPKDIAAGLSVAAIALPVGIAYADLAGVPPIIGMYSAIFPLFAYALFGSSRQLMTGPDAATCILVAATLAPLAGGDAERYAALLFALTIITGLLYVLAGAGRLGFMANFLSQPILTGYLNGIALLIIVGQLPKLFGYTGESADFPGKIVEFFERIGLSHWPTALLGVAMIVLLLLVTRILPRLPGAFVVVVVSIVLVKALGLDQMGVAALGDVPSGLPSLVLPSVDLRVFSDLFTAAAGLVLVSFTSGVLTAKSFAKRNGYEINANQELIAFGSCNLASGIAQGFPVTGADSRTAVNNAMGGKTQVAGLVAGGAGLLVVVFVTAPLAYVPMTALAAVILVSAVGLFDFGDLRLLYRTSTREFLMSVATTVGVLLLGVLPGVLLAIALSLVWLLYVGSRPNDAVLGRVAGRKGFHSVADYPDAKTMPGLMLYRFDSNIVFYNADHFKTRVRAAIAAQQAPVEWVVIDASPVNVVDVTGLRKIDELRAELAQEGVSLYFARVRRGLEKFFNADFAKERREATKETRFHTLKPAINAFIQHQKAKGLVLDEAYTDEQTSVSPQWRAAVQPPRQEESDAVPLPPDTGSTGN